MVRVNECFELSGVNYEEVLEQGDSILVRVIASSSYRGFELSNPRYIYILYAYVYVYVYVYVYIYYILKMGSARNMSGISFYLFA